MREMKTRLLGTASCLLAAVLLLPATSLAVTRQSCVAGPPTPESYTWNFPREASHLLKQVRNDATDVRRQASTLESYTRNESISWQLYSNRLANVRTDVNKMGRDLCRLEAIRRVATPSEKQAISRTAPLVQLMADNTQDALVYLDNYERNFWTPTYRKYMSNLYNESRQLQKAARNTEISSANMAGTSNTKSAS